MNPRMSLLNTLVLVAVSAACGRTLAASGSSENEVKTLLEVAVIEARTDSVGPGADIPATIESTRRAILGSRLAAAVLELDGREGDRVLEGAILVRLESSALKAGLAAAVEANEAATRDLARAQALMARDAATHQEVESAATASARARALLAAARESLSHASIRAPFAGRILRKLARVGDVVTPGQPLLEVEGEGGLEVVASIGEPLHAGLRVGQILEVRLDGMATPLQATLHDLAASADPLTHRFTLRADIAASDEVRAGRFARIHVPSHAGERRVLIPERTLVRRGSLTGVYVIREGRAWLRWIAPGETSGEWIEARAGVDPGERVAVDPRELEDGRSVRERGIQ